MATGQYIGVNGVARKVVSPYVGVDGVARNVKNGYVGVDGVARLFFAPESGAPVILEVEKVTGGTYANDTTYENEEFILLDIYPKTGRTVKVTYGGLTKTITDTSGEEEPNAQQVFFGTFNGVSDSVATPASGTLTIEGYFYAFGCSRYNSDKSNIETCSCITAVKCFGEMKKIPDYAFHMCYKLTSIDIPNTVTEIGSYAYCGVSAELTFSISVNIPEGVITIKEYAFVNCNNVSDFTIPSTVTSIGDYAFSKSLGADRAFTILATTPPTIGTKPFSYITSVIVPIGCGATYKAAEGWSYYADKIVEAT